MDVADMAEKVVIGILLDVCGGASLYKAAADAAIDTSMAEARELCRRAMATNQTGNE